MIAPRAAASALVACLALQVVGADLSDFVARLNGVYRFEQLLTGEADRVQISGNAVVDLILKLARPELAQLENKIVLSNIAGQFHKRIGFVKITVSYKCYNGHIHGLSSLYRSGDVSLTTKGNLLVLSAAFGLHTAEIRYTVRVDSRILRVTRPVTITIQGIQIKAVITKDSSKICSPTLQTLKVTNVGPIKCHISGIGMFTHMADKIADKAFKDHKQQLISAGEKSLSEVLTKALAKMKF